ncbi:DEAD/DEAH box helicase family protein [Halomicroarcula limicola]|uniref:DEAD/DEAH box helicase family protein n=1 Tax=Haloarcula limicola TaxID=1429915 RepID=A0A8J7Y7X7_9EURY|nr:DEAD/DEAH box helicase family protein [Halomicroarcula limicola]MBV0926225.1 DEAD/DEAH box helicase family protein [Halomicroarcula limicola]
MGRRFPTPIIGVATEEERYRTVIGVVVEASGPLAWATFRDRCQRHLLKPDTGEQYSDSYLDRILPTFANLGVIQRTDDGVRPSPFATDWFHGDLAFSEFVWKSLKRSWVAMGEKPEGIEGLDRILRTVEAASDGLKFGEIQNRLAANHGYEFNEEGVRGYPDLLRILGVLEKDGHTYNTTSEEVVERYKRRFRNTDIFDTLESRLKREGTTVDPPSRTAKRDMMKYYMYRESGGWYKRRQWYKTFWRNYLQKATRDGNTGDELRRKNEYREAQNRRRDLRNEVIAQYEFLDSKSLRGLSAGVLERMRNADTEREAQRIRISAGSGISIADLELLADSDRDSYTFSDGFSLYGWQREAADRWFSDDNGRTPETGIAQVVTGAGKTVMALEVLRRWLQQDDDRVATVIVPTKVLLHQWLTELVSTLNVPIDEIGWAGGGHKDDFGDCRIMVSIVNSAVKNDYLREALQQADEPDHLLVADECHRYTGEKFSNIFSYPRAASLGLSATPISREDELTSADKILLRELGEIYYRLTYDEGIQRGLIPEFTIEYVGFELADPERRAYEELSRQVSNAVKEIKQRYDHRLHELSGSFARKLQVIRNNTDGPTGPISDYFQYTQERRELVANAAARQAITLDLLEQTVTADQKAIVFQERIEQLEQLIAPVERRGENNRTGELADDAPEHRRLYETFEGLEEVDQAVETLFADTDYWPVMYHSGHSRDIWNDIAMDWFREDDMANVMLSVKALIEGVDVPSADVGIVRVSSSSIRQRIQTLGRILRTGDDISQESTLYVLYARDTVDERIFQEYDWQEELASAKVKHKIWEREGDESYSDGQIRPADPEEYPPRPEPEIIPDPDELTIGDDYEGTREPIKRVSVDSRGRLFEKTRNGRQYLSTETFEEVIEFVRREKGGGTIIVNEHNHLLTILQDGPVFLGTVEDPDVFEPTKNTQQTIHSDGVTSESQTKSDEDTSLTDEPDDFDDIFG